jgi:hypothetical protein
MKPRVIYSEKELKRPAKYIVCVCDPNIDTHIIDIEEAESYVKKYQRRAIIISAKEVFKDSNIERLNYLYLKNATNPSVKIIDQNGNSFKKVYEAVTEKFQNGLIIAHPETLTNEIADALSKNISNGIDFVVYRQDLMSISAAEKMRMNFLRIHYNPEFQFTKDYFRNFSEKYGDGNSIGIFISQYIANYQYVLSQSYFQKTSEELEKQGLKDYIDYYELNKQFAFHVHFNTVTGKIYGFTAEKIEFYMQMVFKAIDNKPLFNRSAELSKIFVP